MLTQRTGRTRTTSLLSYLLLLLLSASLSASVMGPSAVGTTVSSSAERRQLPKKLGQVTPPSPSTTATTTETATTGSGTHSTQFVAECMLPTKLGAFRMRSYVYRSPSGQQLEPVALIYGDIADKSDVLVRVHDQCFTSEVMGSLRCDCREQLDKSMEMIREHGGVIIYLQQEGRGIGLSNKIAAYALQDEGLDTVDANLQLGFREESRDYTVVPDIIKDLHVNSMKLITNNPFKVNQLLGLNMKISSRIPIQIKPGLFNRKYLKAKRERMMHNLDETYVEDQRATTTAAVGGAIPPELSYSPEQMQNRRKYAFGRESVEAAISAVKRGEVVVVVDDEDRENEGDLILAAEKSTPTNIGFIVRHSSGVLCVSLEKERLDELNLPPMVANNEDPKQTAYSVSVDCKHNTTTGISSFDRATTFRALVDRSFGPADFQRPGHVFPLMYKHGGVLVRGGHTEASLDLTRLAGLKPGGVLAEIVNDDGSVMRLDNLKEFAKKNSLVLTSVQDLIAYRYEKEYSL